MSPQASPKLGTSPSARAVSRASGTVCAWKKGHLPLVLGLDVREQQRRVPRVVALGAGELKTDRLLAASVGRDRLVEAGRSGRVLRDPHAGGHRHEHERRSVGGREFEAAVRIGARDRESIRNRHARKAAAVGLDETAHPDRIVRPRRPGDARAGGRHPWIPLGRGHGRSEPGGHRRRRPAQRRQVQEIPSAESVHDRSFRSRGCMLRPETTPSSPGPKATRHQDGKSGRSRVDFEIQGLPARYAGLSE